VADDPVPDATPELHGLMSDSDKKKLDVLTQTRLGVLGFLGSGFPDDQGWLQGDIILAAGTEFIQLERVGNVVRFVVDSSIPLCSCEECATLYWVQDESAVSSIRPPSCGGKLPGVNVYGEFSAFLFPETTIFDPANPLATLNKKKNYPTIVFKRSTDQLRPGDAEFEAVLRRRTNGTTSVGWAMTPTSGKARAVWFMGEDSAGNEIRFEFDSRTEPGILGALLYKGHTLTRRMAVITNYTPTVVSTNQYVIKYWDVMKAEPVGNGFVATNIWRYQNPENSPNALVNPRQLVLDGTQELLPIGTLVQTWEFKVGEVNGKPLYKGFFNLEPKLNANTIWSLTGAIRFGDLLTAHEEAENGSGQEMTTTTTDSRLFERSMWGITGFEDPLMLSDDLDTSSGATDDPSGTILNNQFVANDDPTLPGLRILEPQPSEQVRGRPIFIWHRQGYKNFMMRALVGQPEASKYPPIDILLRGPIDSFDDTYMKVIKRGIISHGPYAGLYYIITNGTLWKNLPTKGAVRILTGNYRNRAWNYIAKTTFGKVTDDAVILIGGTLFPFSEDGGSGGSGSEVPLPDVPATTTVIELLHTDFNSPAVRLEFSINQTSGDEHVQLQFKAGTLDMSVPYELDSSGVSDDVVHGFAPGYMVSRIYTQSGFITSTEAPASTPEGFKVYTGGFLPFEIGGQIERWNTLEVMYRDSQLWIWWNNLLIPPSTVDSAMLPMPVVVNTPYFPIQSPMDIGKLGLRLWPGTKLRSMEVRSQSMGWSEFAHGQLELTS